MASSLVIVFVVSLVFLPLLQSSRPFHIPDEATKSGPVLVCAVEYEPSPRGEIAPFADMMANVNGQGNFVRKAKERGCELVVLPEYGITDYLMNVNDVPRYVSPMPKEWPSEDEICSHYGTDVLLSLGCLAKRNSIYLVVNLLTKEGPDDASKHYNSAVSFDREGRYLGRYRKFSLYGEHLDAPEEPDIAFFDSDFGMRVGFMTCFDINYPEPGQSLVDKRVDIIAFPAAWFDELPFLTAPQFHSGWALANGITVVAAGLHHPQYGTLGSGIYHGENGIMAFAHDPEAVEPSVLVVADVNDVKKGSATPGREGIAASSSHNVTYRRRPGGLHGPPRSTKEGRGIKLGPVIQEDLSSYSWARLQPGDDQHMGLTHGSMVSCELSYDMEDSSDPDLAAVVMVAYSGLRTFGNGLFTAGIQVCGVLACSVPDPKDLTTCGSVDVMSAEGPALRNVVLKATVDSEVKPMPVHIGKDYQPLMSASPEDESCVQYSQDADDPNSYTVTLCNDHSSPMLSLGLYGRLYRIDPTE